MLSRVFVGSSSEAKTHAEALGTWLGTVGLQPWYWWDAFPVGGLFLEAIENVPGNVIGAVMLATPDDDAEIRGQSVKVPRTNVLFETAYFAATLGRRRVALCVYDGVTLISDLHGFTHVPMGLYVPATAPRAPVALHHWAQSLSTVAADTAVTSVWHGYSGEWDITLRYRKWRDLVIDAPDLVEVRATLLLQLPVDGVGGCGTLCGTLEADVKHVGRVRIRVADSVRNAAHLSDGSLDFESQTLARQIEAKDLVVDAAIDGLQPQLFGGTTFVWRLAPVAARTLRGTYRSSRSEADVVAVKR